MEGTGAEGGELRRATRDRDGADTEVMGTYGSQVSALRERLRAIRGGLVSTAVNRAPSQAGRTVEEANGTAEDQIGQLLSLVSEVIECASGGMLGLGAMRDAVMGTPSLDQSDSVGEEDSTKRTENPDEEEPSQECQTVDGGFPMIEKWHARHLKRVFPRSQVTSVQSMPRPPSPGRATGTALPRRIGTRIWSFEPMGEVRFRGWRARDVMHLSWCQMARGLGLLGDFQLA